MRARAHSAPFHSVDTRWILITQTKIFAKRKKDTARSLLLFVKRDLFVVFMRSARKIKRRQNFIDIKRALKSLITVVNTGRCIYVGNIKIEKRAA